MELAPLALLVGFTIGIKHAFEPDHVIAVSTLLHEERRWLSSIRTGLAWGAGHTTTLVLGVLLLSALRLEVSEELLSWLELPVAAMLIGLGLWVLADAARLAFGSDAPSPHVDDHGHGHHLPARTGWRGYAVGLMHGMAGSGALLLLVAATLPGPLYGLAYSLLFGLGSLVGMAIVSAALAVPFLASRRRPALYGWLITASGVLSVAFGLLIVRDVLG